MVEKPLKFVLDSLPKNKREIQPRGPNSCRFTSKRPRCPPETDATPRLLLLWFFVVFFPFFSFFFPGFPQKRARPRRKCHFLFMHLTHRPRKCTNCSKRPQRGRKGFEIAMGRRFRYTLKIPKKGKSNVNADGAPKKPQNAACLAEKSV